jgi:hypothetical protein
METEVNNDLTLFFDLLIKRDTLGFNTQRESVKKKTFTGTYMNWKSLAPRTHKIGLIVSFKTDLSLFCKIGEELFAIHRSGSGNRTRAACTTKIRKMHDAHAKSNSR